METETATVRTRWSRGDVGAWDIEMTFSIIEGRVRCCGLNIQSVNAERPLSTTALRAIPIATLVHEALEDPPREIRDLARLKPFNYLRDLAELGLSIGRKPDDDLGPKLGRPRKYDADHYVQVARIYSDAPSRPTAAVAEHFGVKRTRAANWVRKARELRLLKPADASVEPVGQRDSRD